MNKYYKSRELNIQQIIMKYINVYCSESLISIEFYRLGDVDINVCLKPFTQIKYVDLYYCYSTDLVKSNWLNELFPKMQTLQLCEYEMCNNPFKLITNSFVFLENLSIIEISTKYGARGPYDRSILNKNLMKFIYLNPQIKHLGLYSKKPFVDKDVLQYLSINLPNLESLTFKIDYKFIFDCHWLLRFDIPKKLVMKLNNTRSYRFKNLKKLCIHMTEFSLSNAHWKSIPIPIPLVSDKLEICRIVSDKIVDDFQYDFIEKHPTITSLEFAGFKKGYPHLRSYVKLVDISRIANTLPSLERIHFDFYSRLYDELILNLNKFQYLKEISFYIGGGIERYDITPLQINGWIASTEPVDKLLVITLRFKRTI